MPRWPLCESRETWVSENKVIDKVCVTLGPHIPSTPSPPPPTPMAIFLVPGYRIRCSHLATGRILTMTPRLWNKNYHSGKGQVDAIKTTPSDHDSKCLFSEGSQRLVPPSKTYTSGQIIQNGGSLWNPIFMHQTGPRKIWMDYGRWRSAVTSVTCNTPILAAVLDIVSLLEQIT